MKTSFLYKITPNENLPNKKPLKDCFLRGFLSVYNENILFTDIIYSSHNISNLKKLIRLNEYFSFPKVHF